MSLKSASSVIEVPVVINAVQHLQELACRMRSDEFGFKGKDVKNIDMIIEALTDLQAESEDIHEKFETETIKASVLRHKLQFLPGQIKNEIQGATSAARQSNAEELTRLQTTLDGINTSITAQQERHEYLEKENARLHPERDQVRDKHEDIISQLNQRMAEKASKQIILNETRDKLRETNQKIVDLEEGIMQLKEDLVQERADARMEKKRLKKAVYDTTIKTREQKEVNVVKKQELDVLKERVFESESKLDEIRKSIRHYEASRASLETQEQNLSAKLKKQIQTNASLEENGTMLAEGLEEQESSYEVLKADLEGQVKELKKNLKSGEKKKKEQTKEKAKLEESVKEKMQVRQLDENRVRVQNNILQEAKQDLAWKAEDAARISQENGDMETRIVDLGETHEKSNLIHKILSLNGGPSMAEYSPEPLGSPVDQSPVPDYPSGSNTPGSFRDSDSHITPLSTPNSLSATSTPDQTPTYMKNVRKELENYNNLEFVIDREWSIVATFQKQIEEMRTQLSKERKERMSLQGERDTVQKEVDDFHVETQKYLNDQTKRINAGKQQHDALTREGTGLQKTLRAEEDELRKLQAMLTRAKTDLAEYRAENEGRVATLEREITEMQTKSQDTEVIIQDKTPGFEEFEAFYENRTDEYEKLKKSIVAMKNKKFGLDDAVKRSGRDVEKLVEPTDKLRTDIAQRRTEFLAMLKTHAAQRSEVERNIYTTGSKLRTAMDENERFTQESAKLEEQLAALEQEKKDSTNHSEALNNELDALKDDLMKEWANDRVLEKEFESHDQVLVDELGDLLAAAGKREEVIGGVTSKLQSELAVLSEFLEKVAKRRPKESAVQKKKKTPRPADKRRDSFTSTQAGEAIDMIARANTELDSHTKHAARSHTGDVTSRSNKGESTSRGDDTSRSQPNSSRSADSKQRKESSPRK